MLFTNKSKCVRDFSGTMQRASKDREQVGACSVDCPMYSGFVMKVYNRTLQRGTIILRH